MTDKIIRCREVCNRIGLSRTTLYELVRRKKFAPPQKIGLRAVGWRESLVDAWIAGTWQPETDEKAA
ncbi:MAG: AlpA family phage regulatory protein [Burkholderiales bacterium]|jgi:prophage regulatory protein|nr:AlpA family phage regulatory protein [Burkholderiales bacterium]